MAPADKASLYRGLIIVAAFARGREVAAIIGAADRQGHDMVHQYGGDDALRAAVETVSA